MRTRPRIFAKVLALAIFAAGAEARAQDKAPNVDSAAPAYTLVVDSDASDVLTYEAIAPRLGSDLGGTLARTGGASATRASITIRYRDATRTLSVRVVHSGGQVLEREVHAEGDAAAIQREAILLAGNLARDEARELIDELAARKPPAPTPPVPAVALPAPPAENTAVTVQPEEERTLAALAILYPFATNLGHPDVRTMFSGSLLYGRVGRVDVLDLGLGVAHATRGIRGVQFALGLSISGDVNGFQGSVGANLAFRRVTGVQMATGFNLAQGDLEGAQLTAGQNVASRFRGAQIGSVNFAADGTGAQLGLVNIARHVKGTQVGIVNIAEEVDGAAIGIASITRDGVHPLVWSSNLAYTNIGIKFSTKYAYTIMGIGFGTNEAKLKVVDPVFNAGLGLHLPIAGSLDVDIEAMYSDLDLANDTDANRAIHVRALPGWSLAKHFRVFAGGGVRIPLAFDQGSPAVRPEGVIGVQF